MGSFEKKKCLFNFFIPATTVYMDWCGSVYGLMRFTIWTDAAPYMTDTIHYMDWYDSIYGLMRFTIWTDAIQHTDDANHDAGKKLKFRKLTRLSRRVCVGFRNADDQIRWMYYIAQIKFEIILTGKFRCVRSPREQRLRTRTILIEMCTWSSCCFFLLLLS